MAKAKDQSDPTPSEVEAAFRYGRTYPKMETDARNNTAKVQFPEDKRDPGYQNDTKAVAAWRSVEARIR
jgi:hypothetical protein